MAMETRHHRALPNSMGPNPQPGSLFLSKLPPEIRHQIYEHVFGSRHLHIFIHEQKLVRLVCRNPTAVSPDGHRECIGMTLSDSKRAWTDAGLKQQQQTAASSASSSSSSSSSATKTKTEAPQLAALLTVCRTMYPETADSLYRAHVFHFSNLISLTVFPREVIPRHRDMVRHVRIDLALLARGGGRDGLYCFIHNSFSHQWPAWDKDTVDDDKNELDDETPWDCAWRSIAALKSLHTLRVTIELTSSARGVGDENDLVQCNMSPSLEKLIFQPLAKLAACNEFLVRVNWPTPLVTTEEEPSESEYPFRLQRFSSMSLG